MTSIFNLLVVFYALQLSCPAVWGQSTSGIKPSSGKELCSALIPADFTKVGVPVIRPGAANLDSPANAYCVFESKAGKVEFDIFFPAGSNNEEVNATERTIIGEAGAGGKTESAKVSGADHAHFVPVTINKDLSIVVRKGTAVFNIDIPEGPNARQQLIALAEIVVSRLKQ